MNQDSSRASSGTLLDVSGLSIVFDTPSGSIHAVNGVDLSVAEGETLVVLGESGCGKTAMAKAIVGILQVPPGRIRGGSIRLRGNEMTTMSRKRRRELMGKEVGWVPQDPLSSLNPNFRVGYQIMESIRVHTDLSKDQARARSVDLLGAVGLREPEKRMRDYPHELSGGMRQRVLIAMAIGPEPGLLVADEPTTALDVTVQAEIVALLKDIQVERNMGLILVTHDCALASAVADQVVIMYAGTVVEAGPGAEVFSKPAHPYTRGLLQSTPSLAVGGKLTPIPGTPPMLYEPLRFCPYAPRCPMSVGQCIEAVPALTPIRVAQRASACFRVEETMSQPSVLDKHLAAGRPQ